MSKEETLLRELVAVCREQLAVLKRTEALIRAQTEDMGVEAATGCPKCGADDFVEIGAVMGESGPHLRCQKCGARVEVVGG